MANPTPYDYVAYDDKAAALQAEAKELMQKFDDLLIRIGGRRVPYAIDIGSAQALAQVKLQEAYMWIGKQIRDDQIVRNGGTAPLQEKRGKS